MKLRKNQIVSTWRMLNAHVAIFYFPRSCRTKQVLQRLMAELVVLM